MPSRNSDRSSLRRPDPLTDWSGVSELLRPGLALRPRDDLLDALQSRNLAPRRTEGPRRLLRWVVWNPRHEPLFLALGLKYDLASRDALNMLISRRHRSHATSLWRQPRDQPLPHRAQRSFANAGAGSSGFQVVSISALLTPDAAPPRDGNPQFPAGFSMELAGLEPATSWCDLHRPFHRSPPFAIRSTM